MSVIAYDGRIVAADKAVFNCGMTDKVCKLVHLEDCHGGSHWVASVGAWKAVLEFRQWLQCGAMAGDFPASCTNPDMDSEHLVISPNYLPRLYMQSVVPYHEFGVPYVAGERNARGAVMGAMLAGKNAAEAVELVVDCKRFDAVGFGVDAYDVISGQKIR